MLYRGGDTSNVEYIKVQIRTAMNCGIFLLFNYGARKFAVLQHLSPAQFSFSLRLQGRSQDFRRGGGVDFLLKRVFLELESLVGSGVKSRKTFHFLAFESPRLREN